MISGKMKLLSATVVAGAVFASAALACTVYSGAAPADQACNAITFDGADGKLIGAAPNLSIGSQLQRYGLPE
jgi:hypothetical protein